MTGKKTALIFGASGGIGTIICRFLLSKNFQLTTSSRRQGDIQGDIGDSQFVEKAFKYHTQKFSHAPDVVVNAAAIQLPLGALWECDSEQIEKNIQTNVIGAMNVARYAVKFMECGSIILFSGGGATAARPGLTCYSVAKTGVVRLVENVEAELKWKNKTGLLINAIAPGAVATEMMDELLVHKDRLPVTEIESARATIGSGGTAPEKIYDLMDFLIDPQKNRGLSGRLIHVREPYLDFVAQHKNGEFPSEVGKLSRKGF